MVTDAYGIEVFIIMGIYRIFHALLLCLCFSLFISVIPLNSFAGSIATNISSDCINKKKIYFLMRAALIDLKRIDQGLTLTDVRLALKSSSNCVTIEEFNSQLNQYKLQLTESSVVAKNTRPVLNGAKNSVLADGSFYIFTPTVDDPDNDKHFFVIKNCPAWATFDSNSGTLLGVPLAADTGIYENITISVFDGNATDTLPGFSVEVIENKTVGTESQLLNNIASYSVHLGVSESNLDTIIELDTGFEIQSRSSIAVADTYHFKIITRDINGNKISLPNTEIEGYRIYLGLSSDDLNPVINLVDGTDTIYWVNKLIPGKYFIAISTFDINGNESTLSNTAQFDLM